MTTPRRVLIVDDDELDRMLLAEAIKSCEPATIVAHAVNGDEALIAVRSFDPTVIVLDINMPGMDGFEVLGRLKSDPATKQIPVTMFSSSSQKSDIDRSVALEASGYINKPGNLSEYRSVALKVIGF
ncbi:MAG: response regulator [Alphaproteobacteria bacterium]